MEPAPWGSILRIALTTFDGTGLEPARLPAKSGGLMVIGLLAFVAGMVLVVWGAERFTDGAIRIAARLALSTFYVGAVVSGLEPENLASSGL